MLPDGYPWTLEKQLEEAKRRRDKAVLPAKRTLKGDLHLAWKNTPSNKQQVKEPNKGSKKQPNSCGKNSIPNGEKSQKGTHWCRNQAQVASAMGQVGRAKNVGKDGGRVSLARISVRGARHQVKKNCVARGDPGINRLDRIAKQHDIDYSKARHLKDKHKADRSMIARINKLPARKVLWKKWCKPKSS